MNLLEIVPTVTVSKDILATGFALARKLRKIAVPARVCDGFIGNRTMAAYRQTYAFMLEDRALPHEIGPADGRLWISDGHRHGTVSVGPRHRLGEAEGARRGSIDPAVTATIAGESTKKGIAQQTIAQSEIMETVLDVMHCEGEAILEDGIAASPEAIDVVMVNGYGFPRWRGGPMFMKTTR
ncbi:MAG: hypothetical protein AAGA21_25620 [Pseudomonadota bacterium]